MLSRAQTVAGLVVVSVLGVLGYLQWQDFRPRPRPMEIDAVKVDRIQFLGELDWGKDDSLRPFAAIIHVTEKPRKDGRKLSYDLSDARGRRFPLHIAEALQTDDVSPVMLHIFRGYTEAPSLASLTALVDGDKVWSAPIGELPSPVLTKRPQAKSSGQFRLARVQGVDDHLMVLLPSRAAKDRAYRARLVRTAAYESPADHSFGSARINPGTQGAPLPVPHAHDADFAEIEIQTAQKVKESVTVDLPGVRVVEEDSAVTAVVDNETRVSTAIGLNITIPVQTTSRPERSEEGRRDLDIVIEVEISPEKRRQLSFDFVKPVFSYSLHSPNLYELGVRRIRSGSRYPFTEGTLGPISPGPLDLKAELTLISWKEKTRETFVLPIQGQVPWVFPPSRRGR